MVDDIKFHSDRALAELALAGRAADVRAARAHIALSALHLERIRQLSASAVTNAGLPAA